VAPRKGRCVRLRRRRGTYGVRTGAVPPPDGDPCGSRIAIPALASLAAAKLPLTRIPAYEAAQHADLIRGCNSDALYSAPSRAPCTWPVRNPRADVVLIGDSNAGHFTEPFVKAANEAGFSATVAAPSGCPFTQLAISEATYDYGPCVRFNRDALRQLERLRPSLLVISSRHDLYLLWPIDAAAAFSRRQADQQLARANTVEQDAARGRRAWIVSFEDQLCPKGRCSSRNQYLYRKEDHLSVAGASATVATAGAAAPVTSSLRRRPRRRWGLPLRSPSTESFPQRWPSRPQFSPAP
jgi:hypothetical protein